jgi:hypothetical protein
MMFMALFWLIPIGLLVAYPVCGQGFDAQAQVLVRVAHVGFLGDHADRLDTVPVVVVGQMVGSEVGCRPQQPRPAGQARPR